jgi:hypothetical protein
MKSKRYFETALGQGIGESFVFFEEALQREVMKRVMTLVELTRGLVDGLGKSFSDLGERMQQVCGI